MYHVCNEIDARQMKSNRSSIGIFWGRKLGELWMWSVDTWTNRRQPTKKRSAADRLYQDEIWCRGAFLFAKERDNLASLVAGRGEALVQLDLQEGQMPWFLYKNRCKGLSNGKMQNKSDGRRDVEMVQTGWCVCLADQPMYRGWKSSCWQHNAIWSQRWIFDLLSDARFWSKKPWMLIGESSDMIGES